MNTKINLAAYSKEPPALIELPKNFIPREEQCPLCKVSLIESYKTESDMPRDSMSVIIGHKYNSYPVSMHISCPSCKMMFNHPKTSSKTIVDYLKVAKEGGYVSVVLKEVFEIAKYHTKEKKNIPAGTIFYTPASKIIASFQKNSIDTIMKLKDGYKKKTAYQSFGILGKLPDNKKWINVPMIECVRQVADIFTFTDTVSIPIELVLVPEKFESQKAKRLLSKVS